MLSWLTKAKKKPKSEFSRIDCNSATETLMRAMEHADRMKLCVVIYETKDDDPSPGGIITQEDVTLSKMNWMLDCAKKWLLD